MSEQREANIIQYLIHPEIRGSVKSYLESWMFQKDLYRSLVEVIFNLQFDGNELTSSVIKMGIEASSKKYNKEDYDRIDLIFNTYRPPIDSDRKFIIGIISDFIKEKLFWRGTD